MLEFILQSPKLTCMLHIIWGEGEWGKERKKKKDVVINVYYGVVSSLSWSKSICILKTRITSIGGPSKTTIFFH